MAKSPPRNLTNSGTRSKPSASKPNSSSTSAKVTSSPIPSTSATSSPAPWLGSTRTSASNRPIPSYSGNYSAGNGEGSFGVGNEQTKGRIFCALQGEKQDHPRELRTNHLEHTSRDEKGGWCKPPLS